MAQEGAPYMSSKFCGDSLNDERIVLRQGIIWHLLVPVELSKLELLLGVEVELFYAYISKTVVAFRGTKFHLLLLLQ